MPPVNTYQNQETYVNYSSSEQTKFWKRKSVIIATFLLLILIVVTFFFIQSKSQQLPTANFLKYVTENNASKSYELTSSGFKSRTNFSTWVTDIKSVSSICDGKITYTSNVANKTSAQESYSIEESAGNTCKINISLVNKSGVWLINYFTATT
jgi:hypothetical protein